MGTWNEEELVFHSVPPRSRVCLVLHFPQLEAPSWIITSKHAELIEERCYVNTRYCYYGHFPRPWASHPLPLKWQGQPQHLPCWCRLRAVPLLPPSGLLSVINSAAAWQIVLLKQASFEGGMILKGFLNVPTSTSGAPETSRSMLSHQINLNGDWTQCFKGDNP